MKNYVEMKTDQWGNVVYVDEKEQKHRTDGPAFIDTNGNKGWYIHGKKHRTDGPAREWKNGAKEWFINDENHRIDGPAIIDEFQSAWCIRDHILTESKLDKLYKLRELFHDDELLNELLLSGRIIL